MSDTAAAPEVPAAAAKGTDLDQVVERYIQLRDKKAELKGEYEKSVDKIEAALARIENFLLKTLNEQGVEAIRTKAGTAYTTERTSAQVADWDAALDFIRDGEHWPMLEKRVSKAFVEAYKQEHNDVPPGINLRVERVVNIRRS